MAEKTGGGRGTITDIVLWTLVSGAVLLATYGLGFAFAQSAVGFVLAIVFPPIILLIFMLILAGPGAVLVTGLRKRRLAMIVGPLLLVPIIAVYFLSSSWLEMQRMSRDVIALDMRQFSAASRSHNLVVLEYSRSTDCDEFCQQILARTDYSVGVPGFGGEPIVYRKLSEAECQATSSSARNIRFDGICAGSQKVERVDDGLLIEAPISIVYGGSYLDTFDKLPAREFTGIAFALVERVPGAKDRVLGRWVAGEVSVWPFHSGQIGQIFSRKDFYSAALGLPFE